MHVDGGAGVEGEWERLTREEREREEESGIVHAGLGEILTLSGDGPVTSDWHIPLTNFELVRDMCVAAQRAGMGSWLVIAGDLFHEDQLSRHDQKQPSAGFEVETRVANRIVKLLLLTFDFIYVTRGNHDENLERRLAYAASYEMTIRMILHELDEFERRRIIITPRDHVMVDTEEGPWRVCHTRQYSKIQLSLPAKLADLYRVNVAAGHRHHCAIGFSPSGYRIAEMGGLHDRSKTTYLERWTGDHPFHQSSFMLLRKGRIYCPTLSG